MITYDLCFRLFSWDLWLFDEWLMMSFDDLLWFMTMADIYIYIYWYVEFYGIWLAICIWEMMYGKKIDLNKFHNVLLEFVLRNEYGNIMFTWFLWACDKRV
jgi:hypothetical protein